MPSEGTELPPNLRIMNENDAEAVSNLIQRTFQRFIADTYTSRGIRYFLKHTSKAALLRRKRKNQLLVVAELGGTITGMIAVRKGNHVSLLFVAPEFHRRGIGALLFGKALELMKDAIPDLCSVTVNSSSYAVRFYTGLGFSAKRTAYFYKGMKMTPMELRL
jgi:ribosomal protein S18 acetylase RimI-like enzyme